MARLGILKGGDLRCLSATFMVVVFFCCVFMLSLQPSQYPTKLTMIDLPKDEVVRAQSIPALAPSTPETSNTKSSGKEGKKNAKADQKANKNDKKAAKAKWIKDELPKKLHTGHVRNYTKTGFKGEGNQNVSSDTNTSESSNLVDAEPQLTKTALEKAEPPQPNEKPQEQSDKPQGHPEPPAQVQPPAESSQAPLLPKNGFSNLSDVPVHTFMSPFIETKTKAVEKKKTIAWFRAEDERVINRLKKVLENCPEPGCKLLYPLPKGVRADAIVFEGVDKDEMPPNRFDKNQVFVFRTMMGPSTLPHEGRWLRAWKSAFNWTWSYRKDSDIWQPFGLLRRAKKVKPMSYFESLTKTKNQAVAWIPRTCPESTSSKRDEFIKELDKHVHITEFGSCTNHTCSGKAGTCSENLTKKFFFLLAAEDDLCRDQVTEVFYRAWQEKTHILPVVRGGADYSSYFPEGTYIDTDWFESVEQLAEFMVELVASRKIYTQLLWRKAHWVKSMKRPDELSLCKLCSKLHNLDSNRKWYSDIQDWYKKSVCKDPKPF
ncbi:hypothetical protein ACOMHN_048493 [Nucella lapillus]